MNVRGRDPSLEVGCVPKQRATVTKPAGGGGNGTVLFDGTFGSSSCGVGACSAAGPKWPSLYGSCYGVVGSTEAEFRVTTSCDPAGNGDYRTDLCTSVDCDHGRSSGDYYQAGRVTCTSIPVQFPAGLGTVPYRGWFQFAEAKDNEANEAGWEMDVSSQLDGVNEFGFAFADYNGGGEAWFSGPIDTGWHTLSICTNNANNDTGRVYGIWLDGVRQTFNQGPDQGAQSIGGFPIIDDGASSWPLDINAYTGLASGYDVPYPYPDVLIHGAPLIATMGPNGLPPEPPGGWNSP